MWTIYNQSKLVNFYKKHPEAKKRLEAWCQVGEACNATNLHELKQTFQTADYVPDQYTIFDVGGNQYRIVTVIYYSTQKVYIREVLTHAEYDKWSKQHRGK